MDRKLIRPLDPMTDALHATLGRGAPGIDSRPAGAIASATMRGIPGTRRGQAAIGIGALLLLAGCGGGGSKTVVVNQTVTQAGPTDSTDQSSGKVEQTTPNQPATTPTPSGPPTRFVRLQTFQSPTGNIGCQLVGGVARCDVGQRTWSLPPRPASCPSQVDFGQGAEVGGSGSARLVCAGDTARDPTSPKLEYGSASQVGDFVCVSRANGITCTNRTNGHGFLVNRDRYSLF
jgi:hypothetical protein